MAQASRILIVDDDPIAADSLAELLREEGYEVSTAYDGMQGAAAVKDAEEHAKPFGVVICDVAMPKLDGLELLQRLTKQHPTTAVIMLTGYGTVHSAVQSLRMGAVDYLTKPVVDDELKLALQRALRQQALLEENATLRSQIDERDGLENIVGSDRRMLKMYELIRAVAPSRTTVLMSGESGTGKSMIARAIHNLSPRKARPYVELACGSIPETLLESELFGHVKGAFTGAHADKVGRFLAAHGGTLFLDEINSASPGMQLKLLRVLQEKKFEPVGSTETIEVDVRVVLASNQPLDKLVAEGSFRQDLYYRINVVTIDLPPLRERVSDIPLLAERFLLEQSNELGKQLVGFTPEAVKLMSAYSYPGNVRELRNVVERAAVLSTSPTIGVEYLPPTVLGQQETLLGSQARTDSADSDDAWTPIPLDEALREPERKIIIRALQANDWNRQQTAEQLGINRTTLYKKMKQLGIDADEQRIAG